ncbi:unnamed protein product [Acanthocheilonema viteae]|uniref:G-protein coupled receptors family 1 profile domain-containing protein n=1 Tax=Acanthocheilonema viteae TaxID=6277 RepID=A0A498SED8_ACAVI|nr:unnamed protein product [Acanthocheilonema viteae]
MSTTVIPLKMRLLHRCEIAFGQKMQLSDCLNNLATLVAFEKQGIQQCSANLSLPQYIHNSGYDNTCGKVERQINQFAMPLLQLLCLSGNILNLLIYRLPYFQGSTSVHFLKVKAYANLVFVEFRIFEVIHAWNLNADPSFETFYWYTKPFVITIASISGTVSTWMTLVITVETVLCVLLPFHFRQICTKRISLIILFGFVLCSIFLHIPFIFIQTVISSPILKELENQQHNREPFYKYIQKTYYWLQITLSILIPNIAMLACSILIVMQFSFKNHGESFSQRRKCVIRMTVATTLSHLLLEGPALLTFAAVARKGADSSDHDNNICILAHGNNLLSVINAATPFFVFLAFNEQFRRMSLVFIQVHFVPQRFMKKVSVPPNKLQGISSSVKLINEVSSFPCNYTHL